jgi:hypothetical protein
LTLARISRPLSSPGPLNEVPEVLFALSKLALNMQGNSSSSEIFLIVWAMNRQIDSVSITQGPAIRKNGKFAQIELVKKLIFLSCLLLFNNRQDFSSAS